MGNLATKIEETDIKKHYSYTIWWESDWIEMHEVNLRNIVDSQIKVFVCVYKK